MAVEHKWEITKEINETIIEYFMEGKHLQSEGWENPSEFDGYEYIPDSQIYDPKLKHNFPRCRLGIKSLIHATTPKAAVDIGKEGGLRSTLKGLKGDEGLNLIWWGITLIKEDIDEYIEECKTFQRNDSDMIERMASMIKRMAGFCSSAPFASTSRYGNIVFEYSFEELLKEYSSQFCDNKDPEFRVLGTFAYKQEVMHVILVCPGDRSHKAFEFPRMDKTDTVICKVGGKWIWKPEVTGDTMIRGQTESEFRRWEHATVAFDVPKDDVFILKNLDMHLSYCASADEKVFRKHTRQSDSERFSVDDALRVFDNEIWSTCMDVSDSSSEHNP